MSARFIKENEMFGVQRLGMYDEVGSLGGDFWAVSLKGDNGLFFSV